MSGAVMCGMGSGRTRTARAGRTRQEHLACTEREAFPDEILPGLPRRHGDRESEVRARRDISDGVDTGGHGAAGLTDSVVEGLG